MNKTYMAVGGVTVAANAAAACADFMKAGFVLRNMDELGVDRSALPALGMLKAVSAAGILAGLLGDRTMGSIGAAGLVLFFLGAIRAHASAHVLYNVAVPGLFLALATASFVLSTKA